MRKELDAFKHPQPKQHIRKRKTFIFNKQELDDDEIVYLVDNDYISIRELEKDVGANKNQLRNRYLRAKALQK